MFGVMDTTDHNPAPNAGLPRDRARQLLSATIAQLQNSRCQLETQPTFQNGDDDAVVYIATAEMHLKAALFRLEAEPVGRPPRP
ncbi:MAG: hypothetical protein INR62_03255 [Rhodospirillales bacterium]|nr:hypothetical protein [Acetobacter sp.]